MILHSYHRPIEGYGRDVALEIDNLHLDGIIVKESPRKRTTSKLLREYNAGWILDLHSDNEETMTRDVSDFLKNPYPLLMIRHGYTPEEFRELDKAVKEADEYGPPGEAWETWFKFTKKAKVRELLDEFAVEKYGTKDVYVPSDWYPQQRNANILTLGLAFFRPFDQSVEYVKSLAQYLQRRSL